MSGVLQRKLIHLNTNDLKPAYRAVMKLRSKSSVKCKYEMYTLFRRDYYGSCYHRRRCSNSAIVLSLPIISWQKIFCQLVAFSPTY